MLMYYQAVCNTGLNFTLPLQFCFGSCATISFLILLISVSIVGIDARIQPTALSLLAKH
jgi:hypothetical protein